VLSVTRVKENPERPRCKSYEYDVTRPKMWQFFETVYEETNSWMIEEANAAVDAAASASSWPKKQFRNGVLPNFEFETLLNI
jgi:hypothetical protein